MNQEAYRWVAKMKEEGTSIPVLMCEVIDVYAESWTPIDEEPPDWDSLRNLDFVGEYERLTDWVGTLIQEHPIPDSVNGLYFGLIHPPNHDFKSTVRFYLSGSSRCRENIDWARDANDYLVDGCATSSDLMTQIYRTVIRCNAFNDVRGSALMIYFQFASFVVTKWCMGSMKEELLGPDLARGVFVGLDPWMGFWIHQVTL